MTSRLHWVPQVALLVSMALAPRADAGQDPPDYARHIAPLFQKYCNGCHNAKDAEGQLVLERFAGVMKGGEHGPVVLPGNVEESRLILVLEKKAEPFMPPEGEQAPNAEEIALLKAWIKAGAKGPAVDEPLPITLRTPKIAPLGPVRRPVLAVAHAPDGSALAVARHGAVEILDTVRFEPIRLLDGLTGHVNDVGYSADGTLLLAAAGEPGLFGELTVWNTAEWSRRFSVQGHRDALYAAAISPDGRHIATGGYDAGIVVWSAADGTKLRELSGHNGPVFDLAFHRGGKLLASASGDRTVKLWDVETGARLDTLGQPEKDQYAVAFSPNGRYVVAGGADKRIRVWAIRGAGREGTNPLIYSRFAHQAPILRLAFAPNGAALVSSGEDGTVKFWETREFTQRHVVGDQPDWVAALSVAPDNRSLVVGRLDGSLQALWLKGVLTADEELPQPITEFAEITAPAGTVADLHTAGEVEPNDQPESAVEVALPAKVSGVLQPIGGVPQDVDLYRFDARRGETWIIETLAARNKSPADTKIEVLHADGSPVPRCKLRAVRDSYIEFRPIDSTQDQVRVKNWEEMQLNQYMYMDGEVCKLFRMPQGPDSAFLFYKSGGKRRCYFDTSATVHALEDPVYIVEPYPPDAELIDNGLPVFVLSYANDDDGERKLGSDSRLTFTAPQDGPYLVRVTDVRGFGGKEYRYELTIRPPRPDFSVALGGKGASIPRGSGQRLTVSLDRQDNFHGPVRVEIAGLPPGFSATSPIVVEAGHLEAVGVLTADADAAPPPREAWSQVQVTATAKIAGQEVTKDLGNLGELKLADRPKVIVHLELDRAARKAEAGGGSAESAEGELVIEPGTTITALVRIERHGFDEELKFEVDNLPHGVIVDNIGLNGIMVRKGEFERQIFLTAFDWVAETRRQIHATALGEGNQASRPITLHVRRRAALAEKD